MFNKGIHSLCLIRMLHISQHSRLLQRSSDIKWYPFFVFNMIPACEWQTQVKCPQQLRAWRSSETQMHNKINDKLGRLLEQYVLKPRHSLSDCEQDEPSHQRYVPASRHDVESSHQPLYHLYQLHRCPTRMFFVVVLWNHFLQIMPKNVSIV